MLYCCCSITQSYLTLCDPMDCSMSGFLSLTMPRNLPKFMSIESVIPSSYLILWYPLLFLPSIFPSIKTLSMSRLFASDDQNTGASASASVLPTSIEGLLPLRLTGLISLLSKGLSGVFSNTIGINIEGINSLALCLLYGPVLTAMCDHWEDHILDYTDLYKKSNVSAFQHTKFVIAFLPRSSCLLISWLQSPSAVISEPRERNPSLLLLFPFLFSIK